MLVKELKRFYSLGFETNIVQYVKKQNRRINQPLLIYAIKIGQELLQLWSRT